MRIVSLTYACSAPDPTCEHLEASRLPLLPRRNRPQSATSRGTALVPTTVSDASKASTAGDDADGGTLTDASTPEAARLGAERSPVQIRPPRLKPPLGQGSCL